MAKDVIASAYPEVQRCLKNMEEEVNNIISAAQSFLKTVENTTEWQGIDAVAYKAVFKTHSLKIQSSAKWLNQLSSTIGKHSERLYQRALNEQKRAQYFNH